MTPEERRNVKEAYFDFLDLIIKYRIHEPLGKLGLTHIPKKEVNAISGLEFEYSISTLKNDKIIGDIKSNNKKELVVDCLKSAEDMVAYKNSLIVEEGWPSVQVIPVGSGITLRYEMRRRNGSSKMEKLSKKEGDFLTFLLKENNLDKSRGELALAYRLTPAKVSNFKNSLKHKLKVLGFLQEQVDEMMRTYKR